MADDGSSWRLQAGPYLGEISALCFAPIPGQSSCQLLLAGTGSQILVYDVHAGMVMNSFHVFEGIRVHGIFCSNFVLHDSVFSAKHAVTIAIFGEKKVKVFSLHIDLEYDHKSPMKGCIGLSLIFSLPKFGHWVMDVQFFKEDEKDLNNSNQILAVGLSDNSVSLWDISRCTVLAEVKSPEKCLLYSMRLWGTDLASLRVASGTIFNEVVVWNLVHCKHSSSSASVEDTNDCLNFDFNRFDHQYVAVNLSKLKGHEGSIFRLAWSPDGTKLMSVSDDRSARIWTIRTMSETCRDLSMPLSLDVSSRLVLFGHNARVWDCHISDTIIVTASEDCTCRIWDMDGNQLMVIKDHSGRGIWRCLYDPLSSLLLTAGFDSAIKIHPVHDEFIETSPSKARKFKDYKETFSISTKNLSEQLGPMNSKSEYVRCMQFGGEDIIYVATNHGYVHHLKLSHNGCVKWTQLVRACKEVPIICMDLLSMCLSHPNSEVHDWLAIGDGKGGVTVLKIIRDNFSAGISESFIWLAEKERQLLGIFWCKKLGHRYVFTANPGGKLKLWHIGENSQTIGEPSGSVAYLVAEFTSCFGSRIICLDASFEVGVVVCGDQRGNLVMFSLSEDPQLATSAKSEVISSTLTYFKGAHGISNVSSIIIEESNMNQVDICSTGGDGCICFFKFDQHLQKLDFTGIKRVKELSLIQSVFTSSLTMNDSTQGAYAVGFASKEFIIWDLISESKILVVPCGGWRRPHNYIFGSSPRIQNCFAFLKDHTIHVQRFWVPNTSGKLLPEVLHMQFHGREIHSLCFLSGSLHSDEGKNSRSPPVQSYVATGCEDGSVRLTRYIPGMGTWSTSKYIGEHVGGSAVRSIIFISDIYRSTLKGVNLSCQQVDVSAKDNPDHQVLLMSVGAKQVITCWHLVNQNNKHKKRHFDGPLLESDDVSFHWLSTHMPPKLASNQKVVQRKEESKKAESKFFFREDNENDWRYLAVTGFLVKQLDCGLLVCFLVVACSDATLTLRALLLPSRLWFDVAVLGPLTSPVLALQHIVVPINEPLRGDAYLVVSGSTDGSITFWDLTETIGSFMEQVMRLEPEKYTDCQARPRTGRGSQGGRWWRSLPHQKSHSGHGESVGMTGIHGQSEVIDDHVNDLAVQDTSSEQVIDSGSDSKTKIHEIQPMYVMNSMHQSGVNCLCISKIDHTQHPYCRSVFAVISGGDDQALNSVVCDLSPQCIEHTVSLSHHAKINKESTISGKTFPSGAGYRLRVLSQYAVTSAHSSALKGVWTDGTWVFSTGLDQRVRVWNLGNLGNLTEYTHMVISVPEPETLNAQACGRNRYQIAVAGRGMQMVEFAAFDHEDEERSHDSVV